MKTFIQQAIPAVFPWENSDTPGGNCTYDNNVDPAQDALRQQKNERCARCERYNVLTGGCSLKTGCENG